MGTNYYLEAKPPCKECGRPHERKHIGKSSAGWVFSLRVYPEGPRNLEEWIAEFFKPETQIVDEYEKPVTPEAMVKNIAGRSHPQGLRRGPENHECKHGPGTWDYAEYEFS